MKISIQSLKPGVSTYKERIKPDFIEQNFVRFYPNDFDVDVLLDKIDRDFRVRVYLSSTALYVCDRCLEEYTEDLKTDTEQIYKISAEQNPVDDDFVFVSPDTTEIDLKDLLNETIVLSHPIKMLCKEDCKGLCAGCGANLNNEECKCQEADSDPRWEELRKLIK
ncbi:MAG: DUF177 domain-containing protein [Calditrichae bacterium]|nr:DUF177 domain-containing protein [Calditrichota bacterium]MCB9059312.1 DUF177 domain-containing protein [Calditrichia bacterium]